MKKSTGNNTEKPLITAANVTAGNRYGLRECGLTKAILVFLPVHNMSDKFCAKNGRQLKWGYYWNTWVREDGAALVGPVLGGPMCAVIMEELAAYGVKYFIGYGASGTLDHSVAPCSIMVADAGLCSDGTTKEYTNRREVHPDAGLLGLLRDSIARRGLPSISGKVWTFDAIYREYPSRVAYWQNKGARFVNMETSTFYAVARALGVKAAYLSAVSDNVAGEEWSGWYEDFDTALAQIQDISLEVLESL
jgi:uridine phosphorylase